MCGCTICTVLNIHIIYFRKWILQWIKTQYVCLCLNLYIELLTGAGPSDKRAFSQDPPKHSALSSALLKHIYPPVKHKPVTFDFSDPCYWLPPRSDRLLILPAFFVQPCRVLSVAKLAGQRCVLTSAWNWASLLYSSFLNSLSVALLLSFCKQFLS